MDELKKEYTMLFNGITETIEALEGTIKRLRLLQQAAENMYLDSCAEEDAAKEPKKVIELRVSG